MSFDLSSFSLPPELWSDDVSIRLKTCRNLDPKLAEQYKAYVVQQCPQRRWPFGMPTAINPYILFIGISPGRGDHTDGINDGPRIDGMPHCGFCGEHSCPPALETIPYWEKVKKIARHILGSLDPKLNKDDCIALSGQLNLGTENVGKGGIEATQSDIRMWVPKVIPFLKPKIIITFGLKSLCLNPKIIEEWKNTDLATLLKPGEPSAFAWESKRKYRFEKHQDNDPLIVSWPNHPSKHPFTAGGAIEAAASQFVKLFLKT